MNNPNSCKVEICLKMKSNLDIPNYLTPMYAKINELTFKKCLASPKQDIC